MISFGTLAATIFESPMFWVVASFALLVVVMAVSGLKVVQQAEVMVVERFGRFNRVLSSGVNVIWPIMDRPRKISWRYMSADVDGRNYAASRELIRPPVKFRIAQPLLFMDHRGLLRLSLHLRFKQLMHTGGISRLCLRRLPLDQQLPLLGNAQ